MTEKTKHNVREDNAQQQRGGRMMTERTKHDDKEDKPQ